MANSYILPPEGVPFKGEGMFGLAYIDTPLGAYDKHSLQHKHWTIILDTKNFKGPLSYYLPEYWSQVGKWTNTDGKKYPPSDYSKLGMKTSHFGFEFGYIPALGEKTAAGDVFVKIPKMQMSRNMGDKTFLMGGFKTWDDQKDLYTIVESLLSG